MKKSKLTALVLTLAMIISMFTFTLSSCGGSEDAPEETRTARVVVTGLDGDLIFDQDVELTGTPDELHLIRYLEEAGLRNEFVVNYDYATHSILKIGDYEPIFNFEDEEETTTETPTVETDEDGNEIIVETTTEAPFIQYSWFVYINGTALTTGIKDEIQVNDGDTIEWKYEVYVDTPED